MADRTIAIVGSRGHANIVLRELPSLAQLRLVAASPGGDTIEPIARWAAERKLSPRNFDDYRRMLDEARPDIVAVIGPFEQHAKMCADAIERGIHVLTEKPAALTLDDLEMLRQTCRRNPNIHLAGMMQSRYDPGFYTAARLIESGAIGQVRLVNARKSYRMGKRPAYYFDRGTYGGTIPWVGSHAIDWVMWYAGDAFRSVCATHSSAHNGGHGTMESSAACLFEFEDGAAATVSIDVLRSAKAPSHGDDWVRIVGSSGAIEARPQTLRLINAESDGSTAIPATCDRTLMRDFLDHIDGKARALIDAESTLTLTEVCLLARQSADEKRVLEFKPPRTGG